MFNCLKEYQKWKKHAENIKMAKFEALGFNE